MTCIMDGVETDCGTVSGALDSGAATQCPYNFCSGFINHQAAQFIAGAGGAQGYVNLSDFSKGLNEVNGQFLTNAQYNAYATSTFGGRIDAQRLVLAQKIADKSNGTLSYQDAYDSLDPSGGHLQGGNYNFVALDGLGPNNLNCGGDSRCDGVHFPAQDANGNWFVHLDTSNPFTGPVGFFEHGFVDVFLGNTAYTVIPRPWP
jgi:hypothetical protein